MRSRTRSTRSRTDPLWTRGVVVTATLATADCLAVMASGRCGGHARPSRARESRPLSVDQRAPTRGAVLTRSEAIRQWWRVLERPLETVRPCRWVSSTWVTRPPVWPWPLVDGCPRSRCVRPAPASDRSSWPQSDYSLNSRNGGRSGEGAVARSSSRSPSMFGLVAGFQGSGRLEYSAGDTPPRIV